MSGLDSIVSPLRSVLALPWVVLSLWSVSGCRCEVPEVPVTPADDSSSPNVLLVVLDTVRADRLGAWGYERPTSPHLDSLAREGVLFRRAVSPGMWTLPSHASMFTGLPVSGHGVNAHHKWLDDRFETVAELLRDHGYATWLLSANPFLQAQTNLTQGFQEVQYPWQPPLRGPASAHTRSKIHPKDASNSLGPAWRRGPYDAGRPADQAKDLGPVAGKALSTWLGRQQGPWFAFVNLMEAHTPRVPSMDSRLAVTPDPEHIPEQWVVDQADGYQLAYTVGLHSYDDRSLQRISEVYDAAVRDADAALGGLVDAVRRAGALDNTWIIVTSDHGEHLGEHGLLGHKFSLYQPLIHVPLVVRAPGAETTGLIREDVVSTADVFPTILEAAGVPVPDGIPAQSLVAERSLDGPAFAELVAATPRALMRLDRHHPGLDWSPWLRTWASVQRGWMKCLVRSDGQRFLYDLQVDPLEQENVLEAFPVVADSLCPEIDAWRSSFRAYDPSDKSPEDLRGVTLPDETRQRLEALGYVDP